LCEGGATEGGFDCKGIFSIQAFLDFADKQLARFDGGQLRGQWGQTLGEIIRIQKMQTMRFVAQKAPRISRFACSIRSGKKIKHWWLVAHWCPTRSFD
jgi:hypothetical protein